MGLGSKVYLDPGWNLTRNTVQLFDDKVLTMRVVGRPASAGRSPFLLHALKGLRFSGATALCRHMCSM